ncbi:hypothetical protein GCM10025734_61890 [Kitasatospora paranensis]
MLDHAPVDRPPGVTPGTTSGIASGTTSSATAGAAPCPTPGPAPSGVGPRRQPVTTCRSPASTDSGSRLPGGGNGQTKWSAKAHGGR